MRDTDVASQRVSQQSFAKFDQPWLKIGPRDIGQLKKLTAR